MALRVACATPGLFTAIAAYGAVNAAPCPDPAPVSLLEATGTADPEVTIGPGGTPQRVNGYPEPTVRRRSTGTGAPTAAPPPPAPGPKAA